MNYRHLFHAGNFADVIKHVFLVALISHLQKKPTAFCYLDTHAGSGYYDLFSDSALKNKEYTLGIEKVLRQDNPPKLIKRYLDIVHIINNELIGTRYASLRFYPGSPLIVRQMMRPHDQLIACDLQAQEYQALRSAFNGDKLASIHHMDGFVGLKAFLPPRAKRGLVLIDPPYENPAEYVVLVQSLSMALRRWSYGMYMIWYPIKEKNQNQIFLKKLIQHVQQPMLVSEITIYPDLPNHLNGCGVLVVNFPYQFETTAQELLRFLWPALSINQQGSYSVQRLK